MGIIYGNLSNHVMPAVFWLSESFDPESIVLLFDLISSHETTTLMIETDVTFISRPSRQTSQT